MLYKTYDNLQKEPPDDLLPISHSTQNAQIEVTINSDGEFVDSQVVTKEDTVTLIPVTEKSASRSSGSAPHPLCDKLQYLAGDYTKYGGDKGGKYYTDYVNQLKEWNDSGFSNVKASAIYKYLCKKSLISDLVNNGTLICDDKNILLKKWSGEKEHTPQIFKVSSAEQSEAFVRFRVVDEGNCISAVWQDKELQRDFINYYISKNEDRDFCYVTGEITYCSDNHPSKIRNTGDKAKIISANDESGFTYRGRFLKSEQAFSVSYEVSQKAHNALKYLISKQGVRIADRAFVLWGTKDEKMPCVTDDTMDLLYSNDNSEFLDTRESFAKEFNKSIMGYKAQLDNYSELALIGLDAATTGRMGITFYREYKGQQGNELIDRIALWHKTCEWHCCLYNEKHKKGIRFYGTPSLSDIATTSFGTEQGDFVKADGKIVSATVERLITCVCDGAKIPRDIVSLLVKKCFHPQNYSDKNWEQVLTITCSMYRKYLYDYKKEEWSMAIKEDCKDLSYNIGRLLAVADAIESWAQGQEKHQTNAMRYFTRFCAYPCETWKIINDKLIPYKNKLGGKASYLLNLSGEISANIDPEEFAKAKNLDGKMALGFDSQRQAIIQNAIDKKNEKENKED